MTNCASCGVQIPAGGATLIKAKQKKASPLSICPTCVTNLERAFEEETQDPNFWGAGLVGIGAAVVIAIVWYTVVVTTKLELGIVAIGLGWLVAQSVMLGAGNKRGSRLQWFSAGITAIAMIVSEYFIMHYLVVEELRQQGYTIFSLSFFDTLDIIISSLIDNPMTLVFWAIALLEAWTLPAQRSLQRVKA